MPPSVDRDVQRERKRLHARRTQAPSQTILGQEGKGKTKGCEERTDIQTFFSALYCFLRSFSRRSLFSPCVLSSCASCHRPMATTCADDPQPPDLSVAVLSSMAFRAGG